MTTITTLQEEAQKAVDKLFKLTGWGNDYEIDPEIGIPKKLIEFIQIDLIIICQIYHHCFEYKKVDDEMQRKIKSFLKENGITDEDITMLFNSFDYLSGGNKTDPPTNFFIIPSKIDISNEPCRYKNHDNIFDLLGVYQNDGVSAEGKIILYKICIEEYAKEFFSKYSSNSFVGLISEDDCSDMLYKIVFWHELGHWITHWMLDTKELRWDDRFWWLTPNPNELLEGLAQVIAYFFILNDSDSIRLKFMFENLLVGQSNPYHKHIDIMKHGNFSWKNLFIAMEQIRQDKSYGRTQDLNLYLSKLNDLNKIS